jgi:hypothetical protein
MKLLIVLLLAVTAVGCGGYSSSMSTASGAPRITTLSPMSATANTAFTLTITGTGFTSGSLVYFGGTPLASSSTGYLSTTQLTANISAAMVANPSTIPIYVRTAVGNSNTVNFTVN